MSEHDKPSHARQANPATDHQTERRGGLSGKWLILITLSLFIIVPLVTWLSLWVVESDLTGTRQPLVWSRRDQWTVLPASQITLHLGTMASARRNRTYKDSPLQISAATDQMLRRCAALAKQPRKAFKSQATFDQLTELASTYPQAYYPPYLLATWHRLHGNPERYDRRMAQAVDRAQAVIIQPVLTDRGQPAANLAIGRIDVGLDRIVDDKLDQTLALVYPYLNTDRLGRAYLPIHKSIYRIDQAQPRNIDQPRPDLPRWFTFPGNAGSLPAWHAQP